MRVRGRLLLFEKAEKLHGALSQEDFESWKRHGGVSPHTSSPYVIHSKLSETESSLDRISGDQDNEMAALCTGTAGRAHMPQGLKHFLSPSLVSCFCYAPFFPPTENHILEVFFLKTLDGFSVIAGS